MAVVLSSKILYSNALLLGVDFSSNLGRLRIGSFSIPGEFWNSFLESRRRHLTGFLVSSAKIDNQPKRVASPPYCKFCPFQLQSEQRDGPNECKPLPSSCVAILLASVNDHDQFHSIFLSVHVGMRQYPNNSWSHGSYLATYVTVSFFSRARLKDISLLYMSYGDSIMSICIFVQLVGY